MLAILGLGNGELIIILVILLLMFGATKLPQLAKGLGKSVKEFKKASSESEDDDAEDAEAEAPPKAKKQIAAKVRKQLPAPSDDAADEEESVSDSARSDKRRS